MKKEFSSLDYQSGDRSVGLTECDRSENNAKIITITVNLEILVCTHNLVLLPMKLFVHMLF